MKRKEDLKRIGKKVVMGTLGLVAVVMAAIAAGSTVAADATVKLIDKLMNKEE